MIKDSNLIGTVIAPPFGWGEFKVGDLFEIKSTSALNYDVFNHNGAVPYVVRSTVNNGIREYVDFHDKTKLNKGNVITLGIDTASYFYQKEDFYAGVKVKSLRLRHHVLNKELAQFLIVVLKKKAGQYGYAGGKAFSEDELRNTIITLPVTAEGEPDYEWMARYLQELENEYLQELETYLQVSGLSDTVLSDEELNVLDKFRGGGVLTAEFKVGDLFEAKNTRVYAELSDSEILSSSSQANTPFITTTSTNNGIRGFSHLEPLNDGNRITYSDTTTGDAVFYQEKPFIGRAHVSYLEPRVKTFNKHIALFVIGLIKKSTIGVFSYGKKLNKESMSNIILELPVTDDGQPDYAFMDVFIRAQEKLSIQKLDTFRQHQIQVTKSVI